MMSWFGLIIPPPHPLLPQSIDYLLNELLFSSIDWFVDYLTICYWFSQSFCLGPRPAPLPLPPWNLCPLFPDPKLYLSYVQIFRLWYVQFLVCVMCGSLVCLVSSFRYTTARIRDLSLAPLALARSALCTSLRSPQKVWPAPPPHPLKPKY